MNYKSFEDLEVWKKSFNLSVNIYKCFIDLKDFGFKDQITRSALSIPSNIAEGYERNYTKEFIRFLKIAKGSCGELRTQLAIGKEVNYIKECKYEEFFNECIIISKMLSSLISKLSSTHS